MSDFAFKPSSKRPARYSTDAQYQAQRANDKKRDEADVQRRQKIKEDLAAHPVEDNTKARSPTKYIDELVGKYNSNTDSVTERYILKRLLKDRYS